MARVDLGSVAAKQAPSAKAAPAKAKAAGGTTMDSKQKVKLLVAIVILIAAVGWIGYQFLGGGGGGSSDAGQATTMGGSGGTDPNAAAPPVPGKPKGYVPPDPPNTHRGGSRTAPGVPRRTGEEPPK